MSFAERIWWALPGKLAGMPRPAVEEINEVLASEISGVVSLTEDDTNLVEYKQAGLNALWLATEDGLPPTHAQIREFIDFVDLTTAEGGAVAVHCLGGNGRAGTMITAYLIAKGVAPAEAIDQVRTINPKAIQTDVQEQFLLSL